jgi:hypothetical protein
MNHWQLIFLQSRVNSGAYDEHSLPVQNWVGRRGLGFRNACVINERRNSKEPIE